MITKVFPAKTPDALDEKSRRSFDLATLHPYPGLRFFAGGAGAL